MSALEFVVVVVVGVPVEEVPELGLVVCDVVVDRVWQDFVVDD